MSTLNNILSKIDKASKVEETKLASHKIDLANINDFNNLATNAENALKKFNDAYIALEKTIQPVLANGNQFLAIMENAGNLNIELDTKFKEIGLDWKSTPESKKFKDIVLKSREVNTMLARIKNL